MTEPPAQSVRPDGTPIPLTSQASLGKQLRRLRAVEVATSESHAHRSSRSGRARRRGVSTGDPALWRDADDGLHAIERWFATKGWIPWDFQRRAWEAFRRGESGLVQVPTGAGKTYAAYLGPLSSLIDERRGSETEPSLRILFVTPLRAVSRDIELALRAPIDEMNLPFRVESRTGDTAQSVRAKQRERLPEVLITTPESLCILLTRETAPALFKGLCAVIVDEWHELLTSKRGTQVELCLARLRSFAPHARTWALSATLPNLDQAARTVVGTAAPQPTIVRGSMQREITIRTLTPAPGARMPWAGHLGMHMLPRVVEALDPSVSTLVFTNTRSQAELWFQAILNAKPEWEPVLALHHGSLDRDEREAVEGGLKSGSLRIVVATSSLDLGVDFAAVESVIQIGSVKGIARLIQRAGRAAHRPGAPCSILCVPTHTLELIEIDAARRAMLESRIEPRTPLNKPLDVLSQHLVTCAIGGGFQPDAMFEEVRTAAAYTSLTRAEFDWALDLVSRGGDALKAYPHYHKVALDTGHARVTDKRLALLHKLNIGTIVAQPTLEIRFAGGKRIGSIEDGFITLLRPGQKFAYAGRSLAFVGVRDGVAYVRPAGGKTNNTPRWAGTKLPISESLARSVRETLELAVQATASTTSNELLHAREMIEAQQRLSIIPRADELLIEACETRDGHHVFVYPFDGRLVNAGLASIVAFRISQGRPSTFTISANDYGFELLSPTPIELEGVFTPDLFDTQRLLEDAAGSVNLAELAKVQFREIARVAGLISQTYPGARKTGRQVQINTGLLYDVLREFDPGNLLLHQADREVMERHFEQTRLARAMQRLASSSLRLVRTTQPTPLSLPLIVERVAGQMSSEPLADRIERMQREWELDASRCARAAPSTGAGPSRPRRGAAPEPHHTRSRSPRP
ncbi:MAG TPA: ligase-associated DNA damage response DEXH box helicase [Phycisphaerales bacterium]